MKLKLWKSLLVLLCISTQGFAQENFTQLTLSQVIETALKQNRSVQLALLDESMTKEKRNEVMSSFFPQINASGSYNNNLKLMQSFLPASFFGGTPGEFSSVAFGMQHSMATGIEASQVLYNQSLLLSLQGVKVSQNLSQLSTQKSKEDMINQLSTVYYGAYISKKQVGILQENQQTINKLAKLAEANYQNGLIRKLDVEKIKVNQGNLDVQIQNLMTIHQQQIYLLKLLMGIPMDANLTLASELENTTTSISTSEDYSQSRTDFQLLQAQLRATQLEKKVNKAGFYPSLVANIQYNYNWLNPQFSDLFSTQFKYATSVFGLRLQIPIFDGFSKYSKIQQNNIQIQKLDTQSKLLQDNIQMEVINAKNKWQDSQKALANQETNKNLAEKIYQQSAKEYEQGTAGLTDLLNAETAMREAQSQYINALSSKLLAELEVKKVTGNLLK